MSDVQKVSGRKMNRKGEGNMASYRKRGKLWQARITYKDRKTGEYKEKPLSGFKTKKEAEIAAEKLEEKIRNGLNIKRADQIVSEYMDWWFEVYKEGTVEWGTEKNIKKNIKMLTNELGNYTMKEVTKPVYQKFINGLAIDYALSTIQRMNSTISEAFEEALIEGLIPYNPATRINYPKKTKKSKRKKLTLELEDYKKLIGWIEEEWMENHPHYVYMTHLLVATGVRIGEICAFAVEDIDFEEKTLNIDKTLVREKGVIKVKPTTKTGESGERVIALDDYTLQKMKEWKAIRAKIVIGLGKVERPDFFFIKEYGEHVTMSGYADMLRKLCEKKKFMHVSPHMFKHTHETILWESDVADLNYIGARLGNTDKTILLNTYGHMSKKSERVNNKKINDYMHSWLGND